MKKILLTMLMIYISGCASNPIGTANPTPIAPISTDQTQVWNGQLLPEDKHCQAYFVTAQFTLDKLNTEVGQQKPSLVPQRVVRIASASTQSDCHVTLTYADGQTAGGVLSFVTDNSGHVTSVTWVADKDLAASKQTCPLTEKLSKYIKDFGVYSCTFPAPAALQQATHGSASVELMRNTAFHNYKPVLRLVALQTCADTIQNKLINEIPDADPNVNNRLLQDAANNYQYYIGDDGHVGYSASPLGADTDAYLYGLNPQSVVNTAIQVAGDALILLNKIQSNPRKYRFIYIRDAVDLINICAQQHDFILSN